MLNIVYFGNTVQAWAIAFGSFLLIFNLLVIIRSVLRSRIKAISERTEILLDDFAVEILGHLKLFFFLAVAVYIASFALILEPGLRQGVNRCVVMLSLLQFGMLGNQSVSFWVKRYFSKSLENPAAVSSIGLISFAAKFSLFCVLVLLAIHNLGFDITTLIAGLGVSGIAVALAVQNILGDLFASLTIILDKPFVVGDLVAVGDFMGYVELIGLKNTRLRSLTGEQLIFSNGDLLQSRVRNYKKMTERRISFTLEVVYQTSPKKIRMIPGIVKEVIDRTPNARYARCHFLNFGSSSLDFETVYYVESPDFDVYAEVAQTINTLIFERFLEAKIGFAYPSRTMYMVKAQDEGGKPVDSSQLAVEVK